VPCFPFLRPVRAKVKVNRSPILLPLQGVGGLYTDTQGVALGYELAALSGRYTPHKIRHLAAELCNELFGASIVAHFARKVRATNT